MFGCHPLLLPSLNDPTEGVALKATEYIAKLQQLMSEHGDLECVDAYDNSISAPEEVEGAFVLADQA